MTLVRFLVVGATNTAVTFVSSFVLLRLGVAAPLAAAAGWSLGAANGYRLNRTWTFRSQRRGPATAARYVAVQGLGALLSALVVAGADLPRLEALAVAVPLVTAVTYTLSRRVVFRGARLA